MREYWDNLSQQLKPKIHELSAYLIAFTCCWLLVFHAKLRQTLLIIFGGFGTLSPFFIGLGLVASLGLCLSLIHAFLRVKKSDPEKFLMGWFIMGASGVASFAIGLEMLPARSSLLMLLPVWNMLMGLLMLFQMGFEKYEVNDEDASLRSVFGTTAILVLILWLVDLSLRLSWALTLSICIFYATTIVFIANQIVKYFRAQSPDPLK
jgi:hypothetical protein